MASRCFASIACVQLLPNQYILQLLFHPPNYKLMMAHPDSLGKPNYFSSCLPLLSEVPGRQEGKIKCTNQILELILHALLLGFFGQLTSKAPPLAETLPSFAIRDITDLNNFT